MDWSEAPAAPGITADFLDALAAAPDAGSALQQVDHRRAAIAPHSIFSIQQNVTTRQDAAGEIRLRRLYSSEGASFPVNGAKRKSLTEWTECLFVQGRVFVGEGEHVLARHFDDFEQMRVHGLRSVVNVPLLQGPVCYATFNVFGTQPRWSAQQVLDLRLLALAVARWVPAVPGLHYRLQRTVA